MNSQPSAGKDARSTETKPPPGSAATAASPLDVVPSAACHDKPPCGNEQIAWHYLAPEARMRRWTETIEILDLRRSRREITIDFSLPTCAMDERWMLPTAYLDKTPVAPDLEVLDAARAAVSVPTKRENMAITVAALDHLANAGLISFAADPKLRELCHQVVFGDNFEARVARLLAEDRLSPADALLRSFLRSLEDQFLLWVPVSGEPGCDHQIQIRRRQELNRDELLPHTRVDSERTVDTPLGPVRIDFQAATGRRRFEGSVAASRLLRVLGLASFEYQHESTESHRFASFHIRVLAPNGLVVRDIGVEVPDPKSEADGSPPMHPRPKSEPGLTYRGRETGLAHFHCSQEDNPPVVRALTTLGIRGGLTGLWAGAVVFTTLLLWAVHRLAPVDLPASGSGQLEATVAILLIGPALASVWALRADGGELLESTVSGARTLLLVSAVLSVAVALSLTGFRPFHWDNEIAVEVYASLSYLIATLVVIGWVVTLSLSWFLYRSVLTSALRNYAAISIVALLAALVAAHSGIPIRLVGLTLLLAGLIFAAIAAHPGRPIDSDSTGPVSAGVGAFVSLCGAGWFLGFYDNLGSRQAFGLCLVAFETALLLFAAVQAFRSR